MYGCFYCRDKIIIIITRRKWQSHAQSLSFFSFTIARQKGESRKNVIDERAREEGSRPDKSWSGWSLFWHASVCQKESRSRDGNERARRSTTVPSEPDVNRLTVGYAMGRDETLILFQELFPEASCKRLKELSRPHRGLYRFPGNK